MRRFLYVITNIIYNVFVQTFLPLIVFVITKDIKYFIISLGIIYTATIIICFSRREKSDSWEKFDLEKMELNTYRKYLVNIIRNELNKNGLKNVKIYSVTGYVMGMSNYGFFIDFNLFNNFLINDKFDLNRFISVIYHEIGHYKSGIVLIKNKFIIFLLQSTLLFQLSMIIKVKFLKLFSNQEMNFKYKFINFLNRVFDVLNLCYTLWLRNDEYYADRYAYINNKYGNLIYYEICQEFPAQDILHPTFKQALKYGIKFLKPYNNIKGIYLVDDKLISLNKDYYKINKLAKENDPFAIYTWAENQMLGAEKDDEDYKNAIDNYRKAADLGHLGAISYLVSNGIDTQKYLEHTDIENVNIAKLFEIAKNTNDEEAKEKIKQYAEQLNVFAIKCYIELCYYGYGSEVNFYYIMEIVKDLEFTKIDFLEKYTLIKDMLNLEEKYSDKLYDKIYNDLNLLNSTQKYDCYLFLIRDISTDYKRKILVINDYIDFILKEDIDVNCKYIFEYIVNSSFENIIEQVFNKFSSHSKYYKMMLNVLCDFYLGKNQYDNILNLIDIYAKNINFNNKNYYLGEIYYRKKDYKKALQYYLMVDPQDSEYPYSLYCIGFIYKVGQEGVKCDLDKAKEYFIQGSELGSDFCKKELKKMSSITIQYTINE